MRTWACAAIIVLASPGSAGAEERFYNCEIIDTYALDQGGVLDHSNWEEQFASSTFAVSRRTGEIIGSVLPTDFATSVRVVNRGSTENSFKAVAHFEGQVQVIEIQEFKSGREKPFVAMSMGGAGIVTGVCE